MIHLDRRVTTVKRIGVIMIAVALLTGAIAAAGWRLHKSRTFQLVGELIPRVDTPDSVVALTFDDGPTIGFTEDRTRARAMGHRTGVLSGDRPGLGAHRGTHH